MKFSARLKCFRIISSVYLFSLSSGCLIGHRLYMNKRWCLFLSMSKVLLWLCMFCMLYINISSIIFACHSVKKFGINILWFGPFFRKMEPVIFFWDKATFTYLSKSEPEKTLDVFSPLSKVQLKFNKTSAN